MTDFSSIFCKEELERGVVVAIAKASLEHRMQTGTGSVEGVSFSGASASA